MTNIRVSNKYGGMDSDQAVSTAYFGTNDLYCLPGGCEIMIYKKF